MCIRYVILIFIFVSCNQILQAQSFGGNAPAVRWSLTEDAYSRIIYPQGADSQANRIRHIIEALHARDESISDTRYRKWPVVLQYQTVIPNAYVRMAPVMSEFYMTPVQDNFSLGSLRWDDNLVIHEHRHMQQFSRFNKGFTKLFSFFLGQEGQLLANGISIPDYFFEGDAVWEETKLSRQGRGRLPYFFNGFRAIWQSGEKYNWMKWRSGSLTDLVPDHYALGYLVVTHGYEKYGDSFWTKVTDDATRFKGLLYSFNHAIRRHSGKSYKKFREEAMLSFKSRLLPDVSKPGKEPAFLYNVKNKPVTDYLFPAIIGQDSILVTRRSYREPGSFYMLHQGKETRLRIKDVVIDDYFSTNGRQIVYSAYQSHPRWYNRDYHVLKVLDLKTGKQKQITHKSRYFSADINPNGNEVLAVHVDDIGYSRLHRLNVEEGSLIYIVPNPDKVFYTQTKYLDSVHAVSAVRSSAGQMALVKVNLANGNHETLVPFSWKVLGYPSVSGDTVLFSAQGEQADQVFAVNLRTRKMYSISDYPNGIYYPTAQADGSIIASAFTANGYRLAQVSNKGIKEISLNEWGSSDPGWAQWQPLPSGPVFLDTIVAKNTMVSKFRKGSRMINVHSRRPVMDDPEWGYSLYSDNIFSTLTSNLSYTFNRVERSHTLGANITYGGIFPFLGVGAEASLNRTVDTAVGKSISFNSAKWVAGISVPLQWVKGRGTHALGLSVSYNNEQLYYRGIGKNIFTNEGFQYIRTAFSFSRAGRQARQQIFPHWAQTISTIYRASISNSAHYKLTSNGSFYFPGAFVNHSLVLQASFQQRDSLPDLYSNTFAYSRGYDALSTRQMYKWAVNYHLPLAYPDWGFGNILYCQRIRASVFYDHTVARARLNGQLTDIKNRSTGAELFFDNKLWNSLPLSFGVRYAYLLDRNLRNPSLQNRWEIVLPIGIIPD